MFGFLSQVPLAPYASAIIKAQDMTFLIIKFLYALLFGESNKLLDEH